MDASRGHYPPRGTSLDIKVTPPLKAAPQIAWTASHGIEPFPGDSFAFGVWYFRLAPELTVQNTGRNAAFCTICNTASKTFA